MSFCLFVNKYYGNLSHAEICEFRKWKSSTFRNELATQILHFITISQNSNLKHTSNIQKLNFGSSLKLLFLTTVCGEQVFFSTVEHLRSYSSTTLTLSYTKSLGRTLKPYLPLILKVRTLKLDVFFIVLNQMLT